MRPLIDRFLFPGSEVPPEDPVSMRKSTKFLDHIATCFGIFFSRTEFLEQGNGPVLQADVFRVHEGHIDENALFGGQFLVNLLTDRHFRNLLCQKIGGIGSVAATKHVARHLIKEDDGRKHRFGIRQKVCRGFRFILVPQFKKPDFANHVQRGTSVPPVLWIQLLKPE